MAQGLYLGKQFDPKSGMLGERVDLDPADLLTRGLIVGMTAGLRHGDLPGWLAQGGAKALEKALRDRLPDKLAVALLVDPVRKETSSPGESRQAFAARLAASGGGEAAAKLRDKLERKKRDLAVREQDLAGRKSEKWVALGSAVLQNIGVLTGRKRTISGATSVLSKSRMEDTAEARALALRAEVAELERELQEHAEVDPARFVEQSLLPAKTGVKLLRYDLV